MVPYLCLSGFLAYQPFVSRTRSIGSNSLTLSTTSYSALCADTGRLLNSACTAAKLDGVRDTCQLAIVPAALPSSAEAALGPNATGTAGRSAAAPGLAAAAGLAADIGRLHYNRNVPQKEISHFRAPTPDSPAKALTLHLPRRHFEFSTAFLRARIGQRSPSPLLTSLLISFQNHCFLVGHLLSDHITSSCVSCLVVMGGLRYGLGSMAGGR